MVVVFAVVALLVASASASAYNARPKLVVVIVIDQFRGDYIERYADQFGEGGFRLLLQRGAVFTNCYYQYANTRTAPGHATLFTGAYSDRHGIFNNEWWEASEKKFVSSVEDANTKLVGAAGVGASPHNLMADTLGDELKLATGGKSHVFSISLKDRASVLPGGYSADAAYWIDPQTGAFITSTYYMRELPAWVAEWNRTNVDKYWNREWKDATGKTLRSTARPQPAPGKPSPSFYDVIGHTPFANDDELDFARQLIEREKLGQGPATDLLAISLSANDIVGHQVGPDAPEMQAFVLALDRQLAEFFSYLGQQFGLANVWVALSADHGVAPTLETDRKLRIPAQWIDSAQLSRELNARVGKSNASVVRRIDWPIIFLNDDAPNEKEAGTESAVGDALVQMGLATGFFGRAQLAAAEVPNDELGHVFLHSYSPYGGWWVMAVPRPFYLTSKTGTDHGAPWSYDMHVPLVFMGLPFRPGLYRSASEPVDLARTLASLLGINAPSAAIGRVLAEAIATQHQGATMVPAGAQP